MKCALCEEAPATSHILSLDIHVCDACKEELLTECPNCGETAVKDEMRRGYSPAMEKQSVCFICWSDVYKQCENCEEIFHEDVGMREYRGDTLCPVCFDEAVVEGGATRDEYEEWFGS